jgi:ABC-2 type transport system permease protein
VNWSKQEGGKKVHSFKAGFKNEVLLLLYRRKTIVFMAFSALLPILLAVSLHSLQPMLGLIAVSESFPIEMLGLYTLIWIPLFIFLTTSDLFPQEVSARTLKLALLRPITRFHVYLAKTAALGAGVGSLLLVLLVVTFLCGIFAGQPGTAAEWLGNVKAFIAAFISMMALAAVFVFAAQFFKSATGCLVFAIVLYGAAKLAPFFVRSVSAFSPASYTDWHILWMSNTVSSGKLLEASLFLLSSFVLFFTLGYYVFDRKEV